MTYTKAENARDKADSERNTPPPDPQEARDDRRNLLDIMAPVMTRHAAVLERLKAVPPITHVGEDAWRRARIALGHLEIAHLNALEILREEAEERAREYPDG